MTVLPLIVTFLTVLFDEMEPMLIPCPLEIARKSYQQPIPDGTYTPYPEQKLSEKVILEPLLMAMLRYNTSKFALKQLKQVTSNRQLLTNHPGS